MSRFAARSGLIGFAGTQRNRNQHGVKVVWAIIVEDQLGIT